MEALPYSIFATVQGLSFPQKRNILCLSSWDTADWRTTHTIVDSFNENTDVVIIDFQDEQLERFLELNLETDSSFDLIIFSSSKKGLAKILDEVDSHIIEVRIGYVVIILSQQSKESFLGRLLIDAAEIDLDNPNFFLPNFDPNRWRQIGCEVVFHSPHGEIQFTVPEDFSLSRTSSDLLYTVEYVLLCPWHDEYMEQWVPTRRPGQKPGLSFSGGVDSTAAMCLMPENTVNFYLERNFESMINHQNAHRFISYLDSVGIQTITVKSNHEIVRTFFDKLPGFSTDYACMAHLILLADYSDLDAAGTGMPLENTYFFHGIKTRDFAKSSFWKRFKPMFDYLGIPLYQPVAGCSEILTNNIVNQCGYEDYATSCLRSEIAGQTCNSCWKCFRKNIFNNKSWEMSNEISTFLAKRPLKQGIATLFALQLLKCRGHQIPNEASDLEGIIDYDLSFLTQFLPDSLDLLPEKYFQYTVRKLNSYAEEMEFSLSKIEDRVLMSLRGDVI